jgi:hypothetical protein
LWATLGLLLVVGTGIAGTALVRSVAVIVTLVMMIVRGIAEVLALAPKLIIFICDRMHYAFVTGLDLFAPIGLWNWICDTRVGVRLGLKKIDPIARPIVGAPQARTTTEQQHPHQDLYSSYLAVRE